METDCKAAFNCCDLNLVVISHLCLGVPEILAKLMANHLTLTNFNVRTGGTTLTAKYGGPGKCFETGQGGGGSPPNWTLLHDVTLYGHHQQIVNHLGVRKHTKHGTIGK
mmetsp:Transcript_19218/g.29700  ORF Transcript_19218/g.29700 Transcript_19218/m.29700 type:complete len:109 (-) Transcript_19218:1400-1726(-)